MASYNSVIDIVFTEGSTAPAEPVTLEEAKDFCKIELDYTNDDDLVESLITAARQMCEKFTNIGFVNREIVVVINNGNGGSYLPYGPIVDISEVLDCEGSELTTDEYTISGVQWKRVDYPCQNKLTITYSAGYGELPKDLKTGLLNAIYYLYDNRSVGADNIGPIAKTLLNPLSRNV